MGYKYESLVAEVRSQIIGGVLQAGDALPSVRAMTARARVSVGTALHAYRCLEAEGLIESRSRSGFYVAEIHGASPLFDGMKAGFGPRAIESDDLVERVLATTADDAVVQFGSAVPAADLLPLSKLQYLGNQTIRHRSREAHLAIQPQGLDDLRQGIARHMATARCAVPPDDIVVTNGCTEALMLALRAVTKPGDTVAIESPVYYGIPLILESLGLKIVEISVSATFGPDLNTVEQIAQSELAQAVIMSANHHNPVGFTMSDPAKQRLVDLLARYEIPLIEDDIYGDLPHSGMPRPRPLKWFDRADNVLYCSSFSKMLSPAYRVGWLASNRHRKTICRLKMASSLANCGPAQFTIAEFLNSGRFLTHLRHLQHRIGVGVQRAYRSIVREWPDTVRVSKPSGGFLLWVELPAGVDATDLHVRALKQGISIAPGPIFSDQGAYRGHIRLNCAQPWTDATHSAMKTLGALIDELSAHA